MTYALCPRRFACIALCTTLDLRMARFVVSRILSPRLVIPISAPPDLQVSGQRFSLSELSSRNVFDHEMRPQLRS